MFMGYEVEFTQKMPTATGVSQLCAAFGNLRRGRENPARCPPV